MSTTSKKDPAWKHAYEKQGDKSIVNFVIRNQMGVLLV